MSTLRPDRTHHQMASDPTAHVWVAASAGTGKTRSLTDRILRLLLAGAPPDSIFAITFTRTAAAEMQARVFDRLAAFASANDAALDEALVALGESPTPALRTRARALLLDVLDSPGGLEIRTIHAAAQSLLSAFPVEAGLPPRADPLDERSAALLRQRALSEALDDQALAADFERLAIEAGEGEIGNRLAELVRAHAGYGLIGGPDRVEPFLRELVGLPLGPTPQQILEAAVSPPAFDEEAVRNYAAAMESFGTDAKAAEAARAGAWLAQNAAGRVKAMDDLFACVLTTKLEPRGWGRLTPKVMAMLPAVEALLAVVEGVLDRLRALAFVEHAGAWLRVGMGIAARYQHLKGAAAAVDFDDMVARAADLLHQHGMANMVAERLDRQIRHILVDEAQDTNDAQWRLVEGLLSEFEAGLGQHGEAVRTRFVVGDFKQAIFRFQGTDPGIFLSVRQRWEETTSAAGRRLHDVPLNRNFRSAPLILRLVDEVMQALGPEAIGLPPGTTLPPHEAHREALPARLILLPPHQATDGGKGEAAHGAGSEDEEEELADPQFATAIADAIAALVGEGSPQRAILTDRQGKSRPAGPGDVLILLQARGELMSQLVRALHALKLPVAGVDRARLAEPLAVRDLLSLIRFVLQPADDLALAELLVSPLIGLTHEAIRRVRRPGETLWQSFAASADPAHQPAQALLQAALRRADVLSPHAFLEAVLAEGGRARFRARLGPESDDGIGALLAEALAFEADHPATLQGFLAHVAASDQPLARDPDSAPGLIRLMTVHGAKGLEAPIVVLADALRPRRKTMGSVAWVSPDGRARLPLIFGKRDRKPAAIGRLFDAADRADEAEHNRLLYVAMTRAEQILLVAGQLRAKEAEKREKEPEGFDSWHDRIRRAMTARGASEEETPPFGRHLQLSEGAWPTPDSQSPQAEPGPVPGWATRPPPPEPIPSRIFTPSAPQPDEAPAPPPGPAQRAAAERGILLHRLFEHLPGLAPEARRAAGRRLVEAAQMPDPEPLLDEVMAVLDAPGFAPLFGPDALAEAPLAGHVDGVTVAGTVDRLLITADRVLVVDLKTGLSVPAAADQAHPSHLRQMAAYRAVLRAAFPGRRVEAALLFTAAPRLLTLPDALLDRHWPPAKA
ncbi:double-strand break repair helicase AddA [Thermaurantiacus sp.]